MNRQLSALERAAYDAWRRWGAAYAKHTICDDCGQSRYCRSPNGRLFLCADCFDQR